MDFRDFWYVVAESRELKPGQVLARKLMGEWLAVFRDENGKPAAVQDRCKHRAAQLRSRCGVRYVSHRLRSVSGVGREAVRDSTARRLSG